MQKAPATFPGNPRLIRAQIEFYKRGRLTSDYPSPRAGPPISFFRMSSRFVRHCRFAVLLTSAATAFAQSPVTPLPQNPPSSGQAPLGPRPAPPLPPPPSPTRPGAQAGEDELVSLKLPDADIDTVLSALEIYTGKIILRPAQLPTAPGGYNLKISKPIPKSQAILYLETILAMNNIAVLPMGNDALKIVQLTSARVEAPELILGSTMDMPASSKVASKLFQLDFLRVQEFQQMLQNVTNPNFGQATAMPNANAILVTDTISNLQRIEMLLQQVDRPSAGGMATKFYPLRNGAKASDLVAKLHAILTGTIQQQLGMATTYSADDRSNQVILITDPRQFPFFDDLISRLDVKADPNTRNVVIPVKHAKAADVAQVLIHLIQAQNQATQKSQSARPNPLNPSAPPAPTNTPGQPPPPATPTIVSGSGSGNPNAEGGTNEFSSLVTVVNDDRSNAIVVSGTVDDIRLIQDLINDLDIVLAQVRIEVVMAEVSLTDNHDSGISALGLQVSGDKLTGFSVGANAGAISIGGTGNASFAEITRNNGNIDLAGIISIGTNNDRSNTTVLTIPAVVTSHGKQAVITDGTTVPIISGTSSFAGGVSAGAVTSSITQQQVGTTLTVTPFIGNDGTVQLDIKIELTDLGDKIIIDNNPQFKINTRKTESYVTAHNGDIIVMGGFRQNTERKARSRLGGIPIIGDILGPRSHDKDRRELIFFLRPYVLTNESVVDNRDTMKRIEQLPTRDDIKAVIDPNYVPAKKSTLDKILRR